MEEVTENSKETLDNLQELENEQLLTPKSINTENMHINIQQFFDSDIQYAPQIEEQPPSPKSSIELPKSQKRKHSQDILTPRYSCGSPCGSMFARDIKSLKKS